MSHSKRNTSLAFFTAHERSLLRGSWGTQSTRLSRESFLPFGHCQLCMSPAKSPVACSDVVSQVHVFCRECALSDLMQQRQEIKRLERETEREVAEQEEAKQREEEDRRTKDLESFERTEMLRYDEDGSKGIKRKREAEETHVTRTENDRNNTAGEKKRKDEAGFWLPSQDPTTAGRVSTKPDKLHPICPGSNADSKHPYSLKSLVTINFSESRDSSTANGTTGLQTHADKHSDSASRICPSCKKQLSNTSAAMLGTAEGCGHVICGVCAKLFLNSETSNSLPRANGQKKNVDNAETTEIVRCFVCEADLSGSSVQRNNKSEADPIGKSKSKHKPRIGKLVAISTQGTGFAGKGGSLAKREGVAFQC